MDWRQRLQARIDHLGLTRAEVTRRAGVNATAIRDIVDRKQTPSVENLSKIARALGLSLTELYEDGEPVSVNFRISGFVQGDGMWASVPPQHARVIPLSVLDEDQVWFELAADLKGSPYRRGDVIAGPRLLSGHYHNVIGSEAIIALKDGRQTVGILMPSDKLDRYNIRTFDLREPELRNVQIEWLAPIRIIIRGQ